MDAVIKAKVRGSQQPNYAEGTEQEPGITPRGDIIIAQGLPANTVLVNAGHSYWASTTTAAAPVTAIPTTGALIGLWNGEPGNGKSYVIDSVFAVAVVVTAAIQAYGILANISLQPVLTALANTIAPRSLRANLPYRGMGRVAVGLTLDAVNGIAANWVPMGPSVAAQNTLQVGTIVDIPINGGIILPPGGQLALTVLAGAATASSVQLGVRWHEVILPPVV